MNKFLKIISTNYPELIVNKLAIAGYEKSVRRRSQTIGVITKVDKYSDDSIEGVEVTYLENKDKVNTVRIPSKRILLDYVEIEEGLPVTFLSRQLRNNNVEEQIEKAYIAFTDNYNAAIISSIEIMYQRSLINLDSDNIKTDVTNKNKVLRKLRRKENESRIRE